MDEVLKQTINKTVQQTVLNQSNKLRCSLGKQVALDLLKFITAYA